MAIGNGVMHNDCSLGGLLGGIVRKIKRIFIPACSWTLIFFLIYQQTPTPRSLFSCYWFLHMLLIINVGWLCASYVYCRLNKPSWWLWLCALLWLCAFVLGFKRIPLLYVMAFVYGFVFQYYGWKNKMKLWQTVGFVAIFVALVPFFHYGDTVFGAPERVWTMLPIALVAGPLFVKISDSIAHNRIRLVDLLSTAGVYSLGIYVGHLVMVQKPMLSAMFTECPAFLRYGAFVVITGLLAWACVMLQKVVSNSTLLSRVLYGK